MPRAAPCGAAASRQQHPCLPHSTQNARKNGKTKGEGAASPGGPPGCCAACSWSGSTPARGRLGLQWAGVFKARACAALLPQHSLQQPWTHPTTHAHAHTALPVFQTCRPLVPCPPPLCLCLCLTVPHPPPHLDGLVPARGHEEGVLGHGGEAHARHPLGVAVGLADGVLALACGVGGRRGGGVMQQAVRGVLVAVPGRESAERVRPLCRGKEAASSEQRGAWARERGGTGRRGAITRGSTSATGPARALPIKLPGRACRHKGAAGAHPGCSRA